MQLYYKERAADADYDLRGNLLATESEVATTRAVNCQLESELREHSALML